jgi:hypothetical protein
MRRELAEALGKPPSGDYPKGGRLHDPKLKASPNAERGRAGKESTRLIELAVEAGVVFFRDQRGQAYASIPVNGHVENWPVLSTHFKQWRRHRAFLSEGLVVGGASVTDAVETLASKASFGTASYDVPLRVAGVGEKYYLDLCDADWRAPACLPAS